MDAKELADRLGCSIGSVHSQRSKARKAIKEAMIREGLYSEEDQR